MGSLSSHCNSDRGHSVAFESCLERKLFNYCSAKGKAAPCERGECANLEFGGSSLWVAASQLQAALQIARNPGSDRARTVDFITAGALCGFEKCQR